jgi:F-type H+-transporting ATPase subunit delta
VSSVSKVIRQYAEALADAAEAQGGLAAAAADLRGFDALLAESRELAGVFTSPAVALEDKGRVLEAVITRAGLTPLVGNLLRVMQRNNRLHLVGQLRAAFDEEMDRRSGVVAAQVTTAGPITDAERGAIESRLAALTGSRVKLTFATDPDLIGGAVTRIGSIIYDGSVRTQLDAIKRRLTQQA